MTHAVSPTQFMIDRNVRQYEQALAQWIRNVETTRDLISCFRAAGHPPARPSLIAGLSYLTNPKLASARNQVERALDKRLDQLQPRQSTSRDLITTMSSARGNYPRIVVRLDRMLRQLNAQQSTLPSNS